MSDVIFNHIISKQLFCWSPNASLETKISQWSYVTFLMSYASSDIKWHSLSYTAGLLQFGPRHQCQSEKHSAWNELLRWSSSLCLVRYEYASRLLNIFPRVFRAATINSCEVCCSRARESGLTDITLSSLLLSSSNI